MATVKPFGALRFTKKAGEIQQLVCPPYDIISEKERIAYLEKNPYNIIRLELPRDGGDPYAEAGRTLRSWVHDGILAADEKDGFYIYEEEFTAYGQRKKIKGLMGRVKLEPFESGVVLPHEETLSKGKTDRFDLMCATNCNFSSVYSLYFDKDRSVNGIIAAFSQREPDMRFATPDDVVHSVWIVDDPKQALTLSEAFKGKTLYIADGHHRYETGLAYKKHLQDHGVEVDDSHPASYIMMTLVDMEDEGLVVFPTHRVVKGIDGFDAEKLLADCEKYFTLESASISDFRDKLDDAAKQGRKAVALYYNKAVTILTLRDIKVMGEFLPGYSDAYRQLDVSVLHTLILERLLGVDKENMKNQKNLIYTRDESEALSAVDEGKANCSFLINPSRVGEIADVAGAGERMPQKSTYFYPKLITGHVVNSFI